MQESNCSCWRNISHENQFRITQGPYGEPLMDVNLFVHKATYTCMIVYVIVTSKVF